MDYSIWNIMEAEAYSKCHQSIKALKKSLVKAWNAIPQGIIDKAVDDFPMRKRSVLKPEAAILRINR